MTEWLTHEHKMSLAYSLEDANDYQNYQINITEGVFEVPAQPEPMAIQRQMQRFGLNWWAGGYADQPWILLRELHVVEEATIEYENLIAFNRVMKQQVAAALNKS